MTLAFYGKSRARQRMLLALGLFAIIAAALAGAAWQNSRDAKAAPILYIDAQGANDEPGQKDLTQMTVDAAAGAPTAMAITWNWDETGTSGNNTMDACALFDTDGDSFANYSLCQTTTGDPGTALATTLYSCTDGRADRCTGAASIARTSTCTVGAGTSPFGGNADRTASCTIQLADFGAGVTAAGLLDVCSYPSQQPNSDPSDCVISPTEQTRTIRVIKVTSTAVHPVATFTGTISPGSDTSFSVTLAADSAVSPADSNIVSTLAQTVTESAPPANWTLNGYFVTQSSTYTCSGTEAYTGTSATVPQGNQDYTVCIKNTYSAPAVPTLNVVKTNNASGSVTPGTTVHYTITLNIANGPLSNVVIDDVLPTGIGAATNISDGGSYNSGTNTITWNLATAANGEQLSYDAVVSASATAGTKTNTATATHAACANTGSDCSGTSDVTVVLPTLNVVKSNNTTGAVPPGTTVHYTITLNITNGPLSNVVVNDVLPAGIESPTNISDGGTFAAGTITWNLATATNGEQLSYDAVVSASATAGTKTNTATATHAACANAGSDCDGTSAVTVFIPGQPSITKTLVTGGTNPVSVTDPASIAWVVTVTNPASLPGINRTVVIKDANVVVTAGPTYTGGADCAPNSTNPAFQTALTSASGVTCTMPGSTTVQSTITFTVAPATTPVRACANQDFNNTATLQVGIEPAINAVGPTITLTGNPALCPSVTVTKTAPANSYNLGDTFNWTITLNVANGPTTAPYAIFDDIPGQFTLNAVVAGDASITCNGGVPPGNPPVDPIECTLAAGAATGAHTITVTVRVHALATCGPVTNNVRNGAEGSIVAFDEVTIGGCGEVTMDKLDSTTLVDNGTNIQWTIQLHNSSTVLKSAYILDPNATLVSSTGCLIDDQSGGAGGIITCVVPPTNGNATPEATVTVTTPFTRTQQEICDGGTRTNTAYLVDSNTENPASADDPVDTATFTFPATADAGCITVSKANGFLQGGQIVWNITFVNTGPAATVTMTDTYNPNGTGTAIVGTNNLPLCTVGTLPTGCGVALVADGSTLVTVYTSVPADQCEARAQVSNTVAATFNQTTIGVTSGLSLTGTYTHPANTDLCRRTIQLCKVWRLDVPGELADPGTATFNFNIVDAEDPTPGQGVEITGVEEDGGPECILVDVRFGTVTIDEVVPTGFVLEGWTLAAGAVPDITPPFSTADPASFTLTTEGCGVLTEGLVREALDLVRSIQAVVIPENPGTPLCTITFINHDTSNRLPTGALRIEKYKDVNGDGDADDGALGEGLMSWDVTIAGPDPSVAGVRSLVGGTATFPGLNTGDVYTITENLPGGYVVTRVTVDNVAQPLSVTTSATIPNGGTTVVRFYNQPVETLTVHKNAETVHNGITSAAPDDDDGWIITVSSAACGVLVSKATDANGNAFFDNLPQCTDFVVSENPVNAGSPGFVPVGASSYTGVRPNEQTLTFLNRRTTQDPPCTNCTQPTPTPVTPTATPTATPSATPTAPTATPTRTNTPVPTNTPVTQIAGERTPGPGGATSTPVAPSAGNGMGGGGGAGLNVLLFLAGLAGLSAGLGLVALGRRNRR